MADIAHFSDELHDTTWNTEQRSTTPESFAQLERSYSQLAAKSVFFATHLESEATRGK
jgi:hypothetical protein